MLEQISTVSQWCAKLHLFSCLFMTGLIWIIQIVHYPSFHYVSSNQFVNFSQFHQKRITWIVAPIMACELLTGVAGIWFAAFTTASLVNLGSIGYIWLVTLTISVPLHQKLSQAYAKETVDQLVRTNWMRTALWSIRSLILIFQL